MVIRDIRYSSSSTHVMFYCNIFGYPDLSIASERGNLITYSLSRSVNFPYSISLEKFIISGYSS